MRHTTTFIAVGILALGLAAGAMAFTGYGMMGGGYGGGWGGMMHSGYHMGYGPGSNAAGVDYRPGYNCPGWRTYNNGGAANQAPGYGPGYDRQRPPATPDGPTGNLER